MELAEIALIISSLGIIVPVVFGLLLRSRQKKDKEYHDLKAKADKADVVTIIDDELKGKMKPVDKRLKDVEQTQSFLKTGLQRLETNSEVEKERNKAMIEALNRNSDLFEKFTTKIEALFEKQDDKNRDNFKLIFDRLDKKADKK